LTAPEDGGDNAAASAHRFEDRRIWGVTASIVIELRECLLRDDPLTAADGGCRP